jgi:hypothetical protein
VAQAESRSGVAITMREGIRMATPLEHDRPAINP